MDIKNIHFKSIIEPYTHFCFYKQPSQVAKGLMLKVI